MSSQTKKTEAEKIADLAVAAAGATTFHVDGTPVAVLPEGYSTQSLETHLAVPTRKSGIVTLTTAESLIDFVKKHKGESTSLYLNDDPLSPSFTAVFNDHAGQPGWRDFRAVYKAPLSREWKIWMGQNGKGKSQTDFAKFIEDNLPDIVHPSGADMLTISRTLEAKKDVTFRSATRLSDGAQEFVYSEDVQGTAGKGSLSIPETFDIGIPVFNGGQGYRVTARLRYRISEGRLVLWYELLREHKVIEDALAQVRKDIEAGTGIKAFVGVI